MIVHYFFCIGSVATGDLNFTSTEHLQPAPLVPIAAPATPAAPAVVFDSTSLFATFDGLDVSSARNEAQSVPSNQRFCAMNEWWEKA